MKQTHYDCSIINNVCCVSHHKKWLSHVMIIEQKVEKLSRRELQEQLQEQVFTLFELVRYSGTFGWNYEINMQELKVEFSITLVSKSFL